MNYGSMGNGSSPHLYMEVLQDLEGFRGLMTKGAQYLTTRTPR